jgi:tRNA 2-thiouridine synthesizing protein C
MIENNTRDKTIAIINTQAPFSTAVGKEALDAALIFGSYEQATSLFFLGDGVFQVIGDQNASTIDMFVKHHYKKEIYLKIFI